jgi:hypothetical protein
VQQKQRLVAWTIASFIGVLTKPQIIEYGLLVLVEISAAKCCNTLGASSTKRQSTKTAKSRKLRCKGIQVSKYFFFFASS